MSSITNVGYWYNNEVKNFAYIYEVVKYRSALMYDTLETLYFDSIYAGYLDGDFAECGCWAGGSSYLMASVLRPGKKLFVLDSFQGLPEPNEDDLAGLNQQQLDNTKAGMFSYPYDKVADLLSPFGDKVKIIPGWFSDTLYTNVDPELDNSRFALVHLDVDLYQSYKDCIEFFGPRMVDGGVMIFDEYKFPPYMNASIPIKKFLETIEYTGYQYGNRLSIVIHRS